MTVVTIAPLFTIRLTGDGIHPHLIPASDLAKLLVAAGQTVMAIAARDRPDEAEELILGPSAALDQSIGFGFSSDHEKTALSAYREHVTLTGLTRLQAAAAALVIMDAGIANEENLQ